MKAVRSSNRAIHRAPGFFDSGFDHVHLHGQRREGYHGKESSDPLPFKAQFIKAIKNMNVVPTPRPRGRLAVLSSTLAQAGCTGKTIRFEETPSRHTCVLDGNSKVVGGKEVRAPRTVRFVYCSRKGRLT